MLKLAALLATLSMLAHAALSRTFTVPLYPDGQIPNYRDVGEREVREEGDILVIRKVQTPELEAFLPAKAAATGEAILICPGGGYWVLAYDWEGADIARFWAAKGVAAIVLKYRLPTSEAQIEPRLSPLMDAQRAMRLIRHHAGDWNIDPAKVGVMGFSAGGHLASTLSTRFDPGNPQAEDPVERLSCRPDFSMLIYPVISFVGPAAHTGSRQALLGEDAPQELIELYSNELQVSDDTPPAFLAHAADDGPVPYQNSVLYFDALRARGIPAELLIYSYGGHGFALARGKGRLETWPERAAEWLRALPNATPQQAP